MDRDSEVETVLADEEWFGTSGRSNTQRLNASRRRRQSANGLGQDSDNGVGFDEEENFSSSSSLSSLHEFSDAADSDNASVTNNSGSIVRNGLVRSKGNNHTRRNAVNGRNSSSQTTESPITNGESEVDIDAAGSRNTHSRKKVISSRDIRFGNASSASSSLKVFRKRKVIADDDDNDDSSNRNINNVEGLNGANTDCQDGLEADVEDNSAGTSIQRTLQMKNKETHMDHHSFMRNIQIDKEPRRHRLSKRRKPRYEVPDYADNKGCPQLVYFAGKGDTSVCRKLLLRGASIDLADSNGNTPIHAASKHGYTDTLDLLLDPPVRAQTEDTTISNGKDSTSESSDAYVLRQLLSPFPNVNLTTSNLRLTPLHLAVLNDDIHAVRVLLEHGAYTSITNSRNLTPLETCSNEKIARLLTDRAKVQRAVLTRDKAGQTKLHRACNAGDLEQTVSLIKQGADIDMKDNAGWTPLHEASLEGHNDVVLALLRRGADFNARGFGGDTPLHDACANGHVDVVRSLITAGADPHLQNNKSITPESMAKEEDQDDVLLVIEQHERSGYKSCVPFARKHAEYTQWNGEAKGKLPDARSDSVDSDASENASVEADFSRFNITAEDMDSDTGARESVQGFEPNSNNSSNNRVSPSHAKPNRIRRSGSLQLQNQDGNNGEGGHGTGTGNKREIASLKRLRDEAEKPNVNYYYSSNTSKLSRDERKLQVLVGTIERMEKRKVKPQRRSSLDSSIDPDLLMGISSNFPATGGSKADREGVKSDRTPEPDHVSARNPQSSSLSPKRGRSRPSSKKRIINDDDEEAMDEDGLANGPNEPDGEESLVAGSTVHHNVKRSRFANTDLLDSAAVAGFVKEEHSEQQQERKLQSSQRPPDRSPVITIDGSTRPSKPRDEISVELETPAIAIKSEPSFGQTVEHKAPPNTTRKSKPEKARVRGGRTVLEDSAVRVEHAEPPTQSSIAAQAIRYLPLYTIQLHSDPPTSKLDYFVVDLQIRLLLGMPVDTPKDDDSSDDDASSAENNPLFAKYPSLCRQKVTRSQKERLWEPLAGMFVSNMQFIHGATASSLAKSATSGDKASSRGLTSNSKSKEAGKPKTLAGATTPKTLETDTSVSDADNELVSQFTLHERRKFVALRLHFVKLDEVVRIIRRDFPQVSKQLITITLDLSSIGLADTPAASVHSLSAQSRPITNVAAKNDCVDDAPAWNGPQKMLPLRYALKLYYRDKIRHQQKTCNEDD
ncbi:hypothetical protein LPJ72_001137 [Coemansia sp. Benny D160-2]|nr:hypothetical protein LPJ72_001137 [Coemansia sp. Benny D160-2]